MPDKHGFDDLSNWGHVTMRCIEDGCQAGGPIWEWPEWKRRRHHETHVREDARAKAARQRQQGKALARLMAREKAMEERVLGPRDGQ